jgi:predicted RNase H-like nuclease (RuvC/YqgF family)
MTSNQIKDMMNEYCSNMKYKSGDYEYSKYYVSDYCGKYAYTYDYEINKYIAIPYTMEDGKLSMDFENVKNAKSMQTWVVEGDDNEMPEKDIVEEIVEKIMSKLSTENQDMIAKYEAEKTEMIGKMSEKEDTILKMGQSMDELKETYTTKETELNTFKDENERLKSEVSKFAKEKKETDAEIILSKYSKKINENERKELLGKLEKFSKIEDFETAVKAFVCDKYESEAKGTKTFTTYSHMSIITPDEDKSDKTHWTSYIKEYQK